MTTRKEKRRMSKGRRQRTPPGAPPGTLAIDPEAPHPIVRVIAYGPDDVVEQKVQDLDAIRGFLQRYPVTWVNVDGLGDGGAIGKLGEIFCLHRLSLEDV